MWLGPLPPNSGKVIDVNQTVEVNGVPLTLEKVEISPWVTRVDIKFQETNHPVAIMNLEIPAGNQDCKPFITSQSEQYFLGDYTDKHGDCTATISELVLKLGPGNENNRISGPWVFHFQVP